jgi:hypothetical protein
MIWRYSMLVVVRFQKRPQKVGVICSGMVASDGGPIKFVYAITDDSKQAARGRRVEYTDYGIRIQRLMISNNQALRTCLIDEEGSVRKVQVFGI